VSKPVVRRTESHFLTPGERLLFRRAWLPPEPERVLLMVRGEQRMMALPAKAIPSLSVPHGRRFRESHLFAVALAHGMGLPTHEIQLALRHGRARPRASRASAVAHKQSA